MHCSLKKCAAWYVPTTLMCRLICNLPEYSIRIFNPITSYFLINRYESRVSENFVSPQCIWIIHSSLFVLHLICHIRQNNSLAVSPQFPTSGIIPTRLMCRLICNLPEYSIRIFNPLASYCWFIGMFFGSQISFADRWFWYFMLSDSISARTLVLLFLHNSLQAA